MISACRGTTGGVGGHGDTSVDSILLNAGIRFFVYEGGYFVPADGIDKVPGPPNSVSRVSSQQVSRTYMIKKNYTSTGQTEGDIQP